MKTQTVAVAASVVIAMAGALGWRAATARNINRQVGALTSEIDGLRLDPSDKDCAPRDQALYSDIIRRRGDLEVLLGKGAPALAYLDKVVQQNIAICRQDQLALAKAKLAAVNKEIERIQAERAIAARRAAAFNKWYDWESDGRMDTKTGETFDEGIKRMGKLKAEYDKLLAGGSVKNDPKLRELEDEFNNVKMQTIAPFYVNK